MLLELWGWYNPFGGKRWGPIPDEYYEHVILKGKNEVTFGSTLDGPLAGTPYVKVSYTAARRALLILGPKNVHIYRGVMFDAAGVPVATFAQESDLTLMNLHIAHGSFVYTLEPGAISSHPGRINEEGEMDLNRSRDIEYWVMRFNPDGSVKELEVTQRVRNDGEGNPVIPTFGRVLYDASGKLAEPSKWENHSPPIPAQIDVTPYLKEVSALRRNPIVAQLNWPSIIH